MNVYINISIYNIYAFKNRVYTLKSVVMPQSYLDVTPFFFTKVYFLLAVNVSNYFDFY